MKHLILTLAIVATAFFGMTTVEAGSYRNHCGPKVYKVRTCEIDRCKYKKWAYDHCGKRYSYWATVITYKDFYSNGSYRVWKRSIS